jgi:hypothetical protein
MRRACFPLLPLRMGLLLGTAMGLGFSGPTASGLSAQLVELRVDVEEGAEFVRTSRVVMEESSPGSSGTSEVRRTVRIQVVELRTDGSGMLRFSVDSLTWDPMDGMAPAEAPEQMALPPEGSGDEPILVPFQPGGMLDMSRWSFPEGDDEFVLVEAMRIIETLGPVGHASGLPMGLPPALRIGETFRPAPWGNQAAHPGSFTLEEVEEVDGRRVARIRLDADGPAHGGVTHEGSGHLRIDLDAGRLVEWQFTHRMIRTDAQGGRHAMVRDERVVPGR